jgi:hypothetical protein
VRCGRGSIYIFRIFVSQMRAFCHKEETYRTERDPDLNVSLDLVMNLYPVTNLEPTTNSDPVTNSDIVTNPNPIIASGYSFKSGSGYKSGCSYQSGSTYKSGFGLRIRIRFHDWIRICGGFFRLQQLGHPCSQQSSQTSLSNF